MNHKKPMPANGTRFRASATLFARVRSHAPPSSGSPGTERRSNTKLTISRIEKEDAGDGGGTRGPQAHRSHACFRLHEVLWCEHQARAVRQRWAMPPPCGSVWGARQTQALPVFLQRHLPIFGVENRVLDCRGEKPSTSRRAATARSGE